jgi:hypothetical protein
MWYMFLVQCEESRINHLTPLLVMTMPYACWFSCGGFLRLKNAFPIHEFNSKPIQTNSLLSGSKFALLCIDKERVDQFICQSSKKNLTLLAGSR